MLKGVSWSTTCRSRCRRPRLGGDADAARAVVAVHVLADEGGDGGSAIPVAAHDRAVARAVVHLEDGQHAVRRQAAGGRLVAEAALHVVPAVVEPAHAGRLEVDLLARALSDVADEHVAGRAVEREAPRVPQAVGPDLPARARDAHERVGGRDRVRPGRVDVEAELLAEHLGQVLGVLARVAAAPAVAGRDVEVAVGPELQRAAVVVPLVRVRDGDDDLRGGRVGHVRVAGRARVARDHLVTVVVGVVDEEEAVARVLRMEGGREQALLAAAAHERVDVQEGGRQDRGAVVDADLSALLREEQAAAAVARVRDRDHAGEAGREGLERERLRSRSGCREQAERGRGRQSHFLHGTSIGPRFCDGDHSRGFPRVAFAIRQRGRGSSGVSKAKPAAGSSATVFPTSAPYGASWESVTEPWRPASAGTEVTANTADPCGGRDSGCAVEQRARRAPEPCGREHLVRGRVLEDQDRTLAAGVVEARGPIGRVVEAEAVDVIRAAIGTTLSAARRETAGFRSPRSRRSATGG